MTIAQYLPQTPGAAELAAQVRSAEGQSCQQEGSAGPSDGAESSDPVESARWRRRAAAFPSLLAHV